jgi:hypothetical protein
VTIRRSEGTDIYELYLRDTELAILSARETNVGHYSELLWATALTVLKLV